MIIVIFQLQLLLPQIFLSYLQTSATTSNIIGPTMLRVTHLHKAKCLTSFKLCATTPNNMQQHHATGCANRCNMSYPTMLGDVAQWLPMLMQHVISNNVGKCCTVASYADLRVLVMGLTVPVLILFHSVGNVELHTKPNFRWLYNGSLITSCKEM